MTSKTVLSLDTFDYSLPESLIAQRPADTRSGSRLLRLDRRDKSLGHHGFDSFPAFLREGDLLVLNDTKVFPARLMARRESGGTVEVFLLKFPLEGETDIPCYVRPGKRIRSKERVFLEDGNELMVRRSGDGFTVSGGNNSLADVVERNGRVPLPPYIKRDQVTPQDVDRERYQTVYAAHKGAVAAPTAGLHFDEDALSQIRQKGVTVVSITLHVGPGTFQPVRSSDITLHRMEEEPYSVPVETARHIEEARRGNRRVVAVGTTVVRALESAFDGEGVRAGKGASSLFIYPGYRFNVVDALLTNFHLPGSTLLMLVCAFAGTDLMMNAYREAVKKEYRFYSYGDAMFIE